jgi:hypothetical protein
VGQKYRKLIRPSRSVQMQERAAFCRRLADGASEPTFAAKLYAIADEYDAKAGRAAIETGESATDCALQGGSKT